MDPRQVINNQQNPDQDLQATLLSLKSVSTFINCPKCKHMQVTRTTPECNVVSGLLAFCCHPCWFIYQSCNAKDMNCYDTEHHCQKCQILIGKYESC